MAAVSDPCLLLLRAEGSRFLKALAKDLTLLAILFHSEIQPL